MKVTREKTKNHTIRLTVESEASELEAHLEKVYERMSKKTRVPGFDEGKAPRDAFEKYIGKERIVKDAIEELAYATYPKVLKEQKIYPWHPMVKVLQNEPPKFEIAIPLRPIVELGDYRSMKVQPDFIEVKKEEIEEVLENSRLQLAECHPTDHPVKEGNLVEIDIEGTISGSPFLSKQKLRTQVTSKFARDIPGLYKMIIGIKKGEKVKFKIKLPKDSEDKLLANKEADFIVKVFDIWEVTLPDLNDDFANKVAPGVGTLEKLKERICYNMKKEKEQNTETKYKEKVVETLIKNSQLEYSPLMIDIEAKRLEDEYRQQIKSSCKDEKEYKEKWGQTSEDNVKQITRSMAKKRVLWSLVLDEVAKAEGIIANDDEITNEIDCMTEGMEEMDQKAARRYLHHSDRQNVEDLIRARKTINKLAEIVEKQSQ